MTDFFISKVNSRWVNASFYPYQYPTHVESGIISSFKKDDRLGYFCFTIGSKTFYTFSSHDACFDMKQNFVLARAITKTTIEFDAFQVSITDHPTPVYCARISVSDLPLQKLTK